MCGITGIVTSRLSKDEIRHLGTNMLNALTHRGPDDSGIWQSQKNGLLLAHRRLAIHDLSASGAQPMHSASERYCIVFNGEIYNYLDLQNELISHGFIFKSTSDTEVLLAAIEHWGIVTAVKKFTGMFAFALFDKENNRLHLCRDRIGEKPLYYGVVDNVFYFASELHAIEAVCNPQKLTISNTGLAHYLQYGYISSPHSIYREFNKLPPATILSYTIKENFSDKSDLKIEPYWSLQETATYGLKNQIQNLNAAVEALDSSLHETIRRQLLADVNVGLFLSGGIDSSTVTAIAQDISPNKVRTFTIGYNEKDFDESIYAEKIANHLNTLHTTLYLSANDAKNVIPDLPRIYDEPFADSSQIPAYLVSKLAKEHVTVCLSGDGGDELFAGYNRYLMTDKIWNNISFIPLLARRILATGLKTTPNHLLNKIISLFYANKQGSIQSKIQKITDILNCEDILSAYDVLSSYWHRPQDLLSGKPDKILERPSLSGHPSFINQAMYIDQMRYLEGDNLTKTDRASMAVSLETRLPLLSHEVIELAWKIPLHMKVHKNTSKWVLRNVLHKYVPENLVDRPKMGFSVPIGQWLREDLKEWAGDLFTSLQNHDLLEIKPIMHAWSEHLSNKSDHSNKLWTILMFLAWQQSRKMIG